MRTPVRTGGVGVRDVLTGHLWSWPARRRTRAVPTALDNGQRSPKALLHSLVGENWYEDAFDVLLEDAFIGH